ncbi:MAG: hypothetical protein JWM56_349 [Candidatus Peribacteria bacterium]|nr:hypothetical protein [Candidatus Peribacteria bacterium]
MRKKSVCILAILTVLFCSTRSTKSLGSGLADSVRQPIPVAPVSKFTTSPGHFMSVEFPMSQKKNFSCNADEVQVTVKGSPGITACLDGTTYDSLTVDLTIAKEELLTDHKDIREILDAAQLTIKDLPSGDPFIKKNTLFIHIMTQYAHSLCNADTSKPIVSIPKSGIYNAFALAPTCSISGTRKEGSSVRLSVNFLDSSHQSRTYSSPALSFSGSFAVFETGTGEHQVTCSYRPNYCLRPALSSQTVTVKDPVRHAQQSYSVARMWNDVLLNAISVDRVRPPVQARNLFHFGAMLYDIWTLYHPSEKPYLLNTKTGGTACKIQADPRLSGTMEESMSYAAYALIKERFAGSPGYASTLSAAEALMNTFGYDPEYVTLRDRQNHRAAALGNSVAHCYVAYGLKDGSNEQGSYANTYYTSKNQPIDPKSQGNPNLTDWDHWQPIALEVFVDQGGNAIAGGASDFLAAEWGNVAPFSLRNDQRKVLERDGQTYKVYLDPGPPPAFSGSTADAYKWNFLLTGIWSSHLDPADTVPIDISPAAMGNSTALPTSFKEMQDFYSLLMGGTKSLGRAVNPVTNTPYAPQKVLRGDYTRAMAEYWADGPKSETPPGHWFSILNTVSNHPQFKKRLWGKGPELSTLEWDIKSYFTLGGAMHDAAIAAWSTKGYYDGIRPVSVIRAMADHGQSTDKTLPSYDPLGLPLVPGYVELIKPGDKLAGKNNRRVGQVKMRAWKGPKFIQDPETDTAGVDWILAANWWPYQRPSFVTPPFGGYMSGHSTFSRAAAEVLTALTGDAYFPGGILELPVHTNAFLVFESGPSQDFTLQWATYVDAADACSLSRIWGGIHTPADDIAGRLAGKQVGLQAVEYAKKFFSPSL